jgi:mannose-6-phosphate isomerase-like protein (cupin superfamily)
VGYKVIRPDELDWEPRPREEGEAPRHVAWLTDLAGFEHSRANLWRYEPGSKGKRHKDMLQEETFVVLQGTLTMYLDEPPVREEIPTGGLVHVTSGTPLQLANEGAEDLLVYAYGAPPERGHGEFLDSAT